VLLVDHGRQRVRRCNLARRTPREGNLRQTEIENLGVPAFGDEDVRGLDVAMNDPLAMRGIHCIRNLNRHTEQNVILDRLPCYAVLQSRAVQELHGDERFAVLVVNFVDGADVGMIQCRGSLGFSLKAGKCLRILGYFVGQELESYKPAELYVLGLVDHTHPAAAELLDDAVVRDGLADQGIRSTLCATILGGRLRRVNAPMRLRL
jgi:hypothetical protein